VDWSRERFTFDDGLSRAVREVFVRLYEEGLIYQGNRIINWCPRCGTALAEIEVEYEDEPGELVYLTYPFTDSPGGITVATTRAETMLGDTAVAVHPDDGRYRAYVGETVRLPLVGREIPIVADDAVDPEFGTGAVKVTPAHDPNDYEIGLRHRLESPQILDAKATVTSTGLEFDGMDRFEAREAVKHALFLEGAVEKIEPHAHSVGHCYRCKTTIEPYLSDQWFVKVRPLTIPAIEAVADGETRFIPKRWEKSYFHWMENLRDWCISRQIWWGHRIPVWYCDDCGETIVSREDPTECTCGSTNLRQDEDVLDTWFSSALWPFSSLGWPDETEDLKRFYPNSILVTGFDIIYFWVARMMQMGPHFMGKAPFADTVIHGLVREASGAKMSKSSGNALDPLEIIAEHGADPLRLALIQAAAPGHDVPFDLEWVDGTRRFGNKLWNAVRFTLQHVAEVPEAGGYPANPDPIDAWILSRLGEIAGRFDELCDEYRLSDAYGLLYNFAWSEVFDWYLEMSKTALRDPQRSDATSRTLGVLMRDLLKLFHPAIPFITEELWNELKIGDGLLAGASWPAVPSYDTVEGMDTLQELVTGIRRFRAEHGLAPRTPLEVIVCDADAYRSDWWEEQLRSLAYCTSRFEDAPDDLSGFTRIVAGSVQGFIYLAGLIDVDAERDRLERSLAAVHKDLAVVEKKLSNEAFLERAPATIVDKERAKQSELQQRIERLATQLDELAD
jgi:valyl-tRNA synthetase